MDYGVENGVKMAGRRNRYCQYEETELKCEPEDASTIGTLVTALLRKAFKHDTGIVVSDEGNSSSQQGRRILRVREHLNLNQHLP